MLKEIIVKAASVEEAIEQGAKELGVAPAQCMHEVLETQQKLFSKKLKYALVKVSAECESEASQKEVAEPPEFIEEQEMQSDGDSRAKKISVAKDYLAGILSSMGLSSIDMEVMEDKDGAVITFSGDNVAVLIGHHGDTLDSLQYLVALACNRVDGEYFRITLDCGGYRGRREETLRALAARLAAKVKKSGRPQLLEPMNPYERRIIHSVVSEIQGVYSKSKGEEPNRRVVILSEVNPRALYGNRGPRRGQSGTNGGKKPYARKPERTMEDILKDDFREKEKSAELYSKIEF